MEPGAGCPVCIRGHADGEGIPNWIWRHTRAVSGLLQIGFALVLLSFPVYVISLYSVGGSQVALAGVWGGMMLVLSGRGRRRIAGPAFVLSVALLVLQTSSPGAALPG